MLKESNALCAVFLLAPAHKGSANGPKWHKMLVLCLAFPLNSVAKGVKNGSTVACSHRFQAFAFNVRVARHWSPKSWWRWLMNEWLWKWKRHASKAILTEQFQSLNPSNEKNAQAVMRLKKSHSSWSLFSKVPKIQVPGHWCVWVCAAQDFCPLMLKAESQVMHFGKVL